MTNQDSSNPSQNLTDQNPETLPPGNPRNIPRPLPTMPRLKLFSLLIGLFIYPRLALLNARMHRLWFKTFAIIACSAIIASILQAILVAHGLKVKCEKTVQLCADTLESITYHTDTQKYSWGNEKLTIPHTQSIDGFRLDVIADSASFDRKGAIESNDDGGIIFCPQTIAFWIRDYSDDDQSSIHIVKLPHQSLSSIFKHLGKPHENSFTINHDTILQFSLWLKFWLIVLNALIFLFIYFNMIFTCVFIFVIMSLLFNRMDKAPFSAVIASSFACVIPPFLLTLVASFIPQIPLDIDSLFTVFFIIYLLIIFFDRSVIIRRQPKA